MADIVAIVSASAPVTGASSTAKSAPSKPRVKPAHPPTAEMNKQLEADAASSSSPFKPSPRRLRRLRRKLNKSISATPNESLADITTLPTKYPIRAMTSKLHRSVVSDPGEPEVIDNGVDSDVEIIETNVTVIDLDETSNDAFHIQSAVAHEQVVREVSISAPTHSNPAIDEAEKVINISVSPSPAAILTYAQVTSSASSTPLSTRQAQPLPVSSVEQPILPSTTENTPLTSQNVITVARQSPLPQVFVIEASPLRSLFYNDSRGAVPDSVYQVPLYEPISDDSFCSHESVTPLRNRSNIMPTIDLDDISFDSHVMPSPKLTKRKRKADDSVIFVSETLHSKVSKSHAASFIPVPDVPAAKQQKRKHRKLSKPKQYKTANVPRKHTPSSVNSVQTLPSTSKNSYNPNIESPKSLKRMIIIDGSNIAFGHSMNNVFSVRGIVICLEFFEREGHEVKAVLPQMRLKQAMSSDPGLLETLHRSGKVVLTPCKNLTGKSVTSYDDRFIIDLAIGFDAAIISNDNYRDLAQENQKYREIIESRVIGYTWCNDMILFPKDPYGRAGPTLDDILNRK